MFLKPKVVIFLTVLNVVLGIFTYIHSSKMRNESLAVYHKKDLIFKDGWLYGFYASQKIDSKIDNHELNNIEDIHYEMNKSFTADSLNFENTLK